MRKLLLFTMLSVLSTSMFGQIPDSLEINLPWEQVFVESCESDFGPGPNSENDDVLIAGPKLLVLETNDTEECYRILRTWDILSWSSGTLYSFVQIVTVNSEKSFSVLEDQVILFSDLPLIFSPEDFIVDADPTHIYSFDYYDKEDNIFEVGSLSQDESITLSIYDHTAKSLNSVNVYVTDCDQPVSIDIPSTVNITFVGESYKVLTPELLGVEVDYPCSDFTIDLKYGHDNIVYATSIGGSLSVEVTVITETGATYTGDIELIVTGTPPPPIPMYIEDKAFVAGEEVTLDVWSRAIPNLIAWQFRLNFVNSDIIDISTGTPFNNIPNNIFNDAKTINTVWFADNGLPFDMPANETWFTLTIVPEIDGSTFDLFTTENDPWSSIIIEDETILISFDADFNFQIEERNFLVSNTNISKSDLLVHNNPVGDRLSISGIDQEINDGQVSIYNLDGRIVKNIKFENIDSRLDLNVAALSSGLYILQLNGNEVSQNLKFYKL